MTAKQQRQLQRAIASAIEQSGCSTWEAFEVLRDMSTVMLGRYGATMVRMTVHLPKELAT
jgi:hypothetical protein